MALWSALPILLLNAGGLVVDTPSPDAFCPALEQTRAIVSARLGAVELEGLWHASYVLVHRPSGDFVVLTLLDPKGATRLTRDFPVQEGSCSTASQVIALVLERYFSSSDAPQESDVVEPVSGIRAPLTPSESRTQPAVQHADPVVTISQSKDDAQRTNATVAGVPSTAPHRLSAAFGEWVTLHWVAPTLTLGIDFGALHRLDWSLAYDWSDHEKSFGVGTVGVNRAALTASLSQRLYRRNGLRVEFGGGMLGLVERGWTRGLAENGAKVRLVPGLLGSLTAHFLSEKSRISPYLGGVVGVTFEELSSRFDVDNVEVFEPARWLLGANFGLRLRI